jgi:hypothetical protein
VKSTGFLFLLGIGMVSTGPASALDIVAAPDSAAIDRAVTGSAAPVSVVTPHIPWDARSTSDAKAPDADAADTNSEGGPPTPIVPAAYSDGFRRPTTLR